MTKRLPDYIVIGAQRGGTTSMHNYICDHPHAELSGGRRKEIHFFSHEPNYGKGIEWYKGHFQSSLVTGDKSPCYMHWPTVPGRVREHCPDVRLIALLRNPVDRAYSDYWFAVRSGRDDRSFPNAIQTGMHPTHCCENAYLWKGQYARHLAAWLGYFPREQLLVIRSEDFFANPQGVMDVVFDFLGLMPHTVSEYRQWRSKHEGPYPPLGRKMRRRLSEYYAPHNAELKSLLGCESGWWVS